MGPEESGVSENYWLPPDGPLSRPALTSSPHQWQGQGCCCRNRNIHGIS
ncbi:hypothetical protein GBAR_LOCUS25191 [Geodia barretti]|uniref:Uncharacterized protein n=1 Tax=Geodia barretti TaxID=519541 RepID=A0AA35TD33_GEOBA|nr:hypothetical protein GBAR_LOCUS25191 [Geodia barretti]